MLGLSLAIFVDAVVGRDVVLPDASLVTFKARFGLAGTGGGIFRLAGTGGSLDVSKAFGNGLSISPAPYTKHNHILTLFTPRLMPRTSPSVGSFLWRIPDHWSNFGQHFYKLDNSVALEESSMKTS